MVVTNTDTDHDVSTTYCGSSVGNSIDLLSTTICTTMDVRIGVSQTPLMAHGSVLWNSLPLEMGQLTSLNARRRTFHETNQT